MELKPKSRVLFSALIAMAGCLALNAQSIYPGQHEGKMAVRNVAPAAVRSFDLKEVRLLPGRVRDNLERDSAWMVNISADRLLHSFRNNAGVFDGDRIEVSYPMSLRVETTPDNPGCAALLYGPVLLAGNMGSEGVETFFSDPTVRNDYYTYDYKVPSTMDDSLKADPADPGMTIKPGRVRLEFVSSEGYVLRPFFDTHHTRHIVYWNLKK